MPENNEILRVEGVSKRFGGVRALVNIDTAIRKGTIHAIIGPNGSGKTTVINVITGFYKPDTGSIIYKDEHIEGLAPHLIARKGIGRTFQNLRLFHSMSVEDNIKTALHTELKEDLATAFLSLPASRRNERMAQERAERIAERLEIQDYLKSNVSSLPYGIRRLVEIARGLCLEPEIMILDEPVAGMNNTESLNLMEIMKRIVQEDKVTVVLIEHDMSVVMGFSDEITVFDHGEVIARGTPVEIQNNEAVIDAYLGKGREEEKGEVEHV
jgi:branched-chain amino acid transport system ATP-binding protein